MNSPIKNFSILAAGEALGKLMGFVTTIYLARVLGIEGFGYVGFVTALCGYFIFVANPGIETIGTREIAQGRLPAEAIISSIFLIRSGLAIAAFGVLTIVAFVSPFIPVVRTMVLIQGCNILLVPFMFQFFFRGTKDMAAVATSRIVQSLSYLLLILFLVSSTSDLVRIPVIFLVSTAVSLLPLNVRVLREFSVRSFRIERTSLAAIGRHTLHVGGAAILVQIYVAFDTILLGYLRTAQEVGVYTAAYKIITVVTLLPALVFQSYLPELSKPSSDAHGRTALRSYQAIVLLGGIPAGIAGIVFARPILLGIFGDAYAAGVLPLKILFVSAMVIYFNIAIANPLLAWGKEKEYLLIVGAGACVNIILNIALIPAYGMTGAASATLAAEVAVFAVSVFQRRRLPDTVPLPSA